MTGKANKGNYVAFVNMDCRLWNRVDYQPSDRSCCIAMTRFIKRGGKVWIKIFPHKPVTVKPAETRMGSGKGSPEYWVAVVKPGRILFELAGVSEEIAKEAMRLAQHKLPIKTKFVIREETGGEVDEN